MGVRATAAAFLAAAVLTGCSPTLPATEALGGEPLAWDRVEGAGVIAEALVDGSSSGLLGKPSYPTVTRHLVPLDGQTPEQLLERLVDLSTEQGWGGQGEPSRLPYRAVKSLSSGRGVLLVSVHDEEPPTRVVLTMSVH